MKRGARAGSGGVGSLRGSVGSPLAQSTPWIKVFTFYTTVTARRDGGTGRNSCYPTSTAGTACLMSLVLDRSVCGLEGIVGIR